MKKLIYLGIVIAGVAPLTVSGITLRSGKMLAPAQQQRPVAAAVAVVPAPLVEAPDADDMPASIFEDMLLDAAKRQDAEQVIGMLRAGADPAAVEVDRGLSQKSFLHIVAGWNNQEAISRVLTHLKATLSQQEVYALMMKACYRNRMPFETAAANGKCAAVIPFFEAIDDRGARFVMMAGKDIWYEVIIRGHVQSLRYLLRLLKQWERLEEFLIERHMWGDLLLHIAARNNREDAVCALVEAAGEKLLPAMLLASNVEGLTAMEVAGSDAMRGLLTLYCPEAL